MSRLLINEHPLQVLPSLAVAVGLNEAIILQQIHYWLTKSRAVIGGHRWVYNSVTQWREQFPFWSDDTIARALKNLRKSGIVIAEQLSKDPRDRSLFYRIDYSMLPEPPSFDAECTTADCGNEPVNLRQSLYRTETSAETTTESPPTPKGECLPAGFAAFWSLYPKKVGKDAAVSAWKRKVKAEGTIKAIMSAVEEARRSDAWAKDGGRFVPNPATWLNQGRWKDGDDETPSAPAWMEGVR